jgi:copper chaperone
MCDCSTSTEAAGGSTTTGRDHLVTGMTCQSCAAKVTSAVQQVNGVTGVSVDIATGHLTVSGEADDSTITGAVTGIGYQISTA